MKIYIKAAVSDISSEPLESRQDIAIDPGTSVEVLEQLATDSDDTVRLCVLVNPNTPSHIVDSILNSSSTAFLEKVATCIGIDSDILSKLALHDQARIRSYVAWNSNTSPETLAMLANDKNAGVVREVASNRNTPEATLAKLFETTNDSGLLYHIASNPSTSRQVLQELMRNSDKEIADAARYTLNWRAYQ